MGILYYFSFAFLLLQKRSKPWKTFGWNRNGGMALHTGNTCGSLAQGTNYGEARQVHTNRAPIDWVPSDTRTTSKVPPSHSTENLDWPLMRLCYKWLKDSELKNYIRIHMLLEISQLEIPKVLALLGRLRTSDRQGCAFGSDTLEPVLQNPIWATTSL